MEEMKSERMELLIQVKAFDETYHANVHGRFSYSCADFIKNARFKKTFDTAKDGVVELNLNTLNDYDLVPE